MVGPEGLECSNRSRREAWDEFHEEHEIDLLAWDPSDDTDADRAAAARALADYINGYKFAPGEKLNVVGHSHGGNIALKAAKLGLKHKIDTLLTLSTPFGYGSISPGIGDWYNITGSGDDVQPAASKGCWTTKGCSVQQGAHNYTVKSGGHSTTWWDSSVRALWWKWYREQRDKPPDTGTPQGRNDPPPEPAGTAF